MLLACPQIFLSFLFSVYNRSITSVQDLWYDKRSQKCILLYDFTWWRIHVVNVGCCTNCFVPAKKNIMMQPDRQIKSIPIFSSFIFCICWVFFTVYFIGILGKGVGYLNWDLTQLEFLDWRLQRCGSIYQAEPIIHRDGEIGWGATFLKKV